MWLLWLAKPFRAANVTEVRAPFGNGVGGFEMSERLSNRKRSEHGSSATVAAVIAVLAVGLAYGMNLLGVLRAFDESLLSMLDGLGGENGLANLPQAVIWPLLGLICFGLGFAMIESPGGWRRLVLWVGCGGVIAAAFPVAALSARWLAPGGPMIAWVWTGVCGMIYAHRHDPHSDEPVANSVRVAAARVAPAVPSGAGDEDSWSAEDGPAGG